MRSRGKIIIAVVFSISLEFTYCTSGKTSTQVISTNEQVNEIMPGILQGYLSQHDLPNSLALLPPPPVEGSVAFALDQEYAKKATEATDTARVAQAFLDAELHFPAAVKSFESTLGIEI